MIYVTDTHSLIWFLTNDNKLGKNALKIFQSADEGKCIIIIPTIVLAEISHIIEKGKTNIKFRDILIKLENSLNYIPYNLDLEIILKTQQLIKIPEIHDRIITAIASLINASILTKDQTIKGSGYVKTIW